MTQSHRFLPFVLALLVVPAGPVHAADASSCTLTQVTASDGFDSHAGGLSPDGRLLALTSRADLTGGNPDHGWDLFLYDRTIDEVTQVTHLSEGFVRRPVLTAGGSQLFFLSNVDPDTGTVAPGEILVRLDPSTGERTAVVHDVTDASVSADGGRVAFVSSGDPAGGNPDGNEEVFLLDLSTGTSTQVTDTVEQPCSGFGVCPANRAPRIDAAGRRIVFFSDLDPVDSGDAAPFGGVYVFDAQTGATTRVILHSPLARLAISGDGGSVVFPSVENLTGDNPVGRTQLFVSRVAATGFQQVPDRGFLQLDPVAFDLQGTKLAFNAVPTPGNGRDAYLFDVGSGVLAPAMANPGVDDFAADLTPDGRWASLHSKANVAGGNADGSFEVFLAECAEETVPPPPGDRWLTDGALPDFRFQVRITGGGSVQPSRKEADCIPETLCISGAVPGRSELFVRIVGPKPNGKLWPTLVRFSTSTIEVWIEQLSTESLRYYRLEGAGPASSDLTGLFDRDGFTP